MIKKPSTDLQTLVLTPNDLIFFELVLRGVLEEIQYRETLPPRQKTMVCVDLDFNSVCNYVTSQTEELKGTKPSMSDSSQDEGALSISAGVFTHVCYIRKRVVSPAFGRLKLSIL